MKPKTTKNEEIVSHLAKPDNGHYEEWRIFLSMSVELESYARISL